MNKLDQIITNYEKNGDELLGELAVPTKHLEALRPHIKTEADNLKIELAEFVLSMTFYEKPNSKDSNYSDIRATLTLDEADEFGNLFIIVTDQINKLEGKQ